MLRNFFKSNGFIWNQGELWKLPALQTRRA